MFQLKCFNNRFSHPVIHVYYTCKSTVVRKDKTGPRFQKHFPESKTHLQNLKKRPRIQNKPQNPKTLPRIQNKPQNRKTLPRIQNMSGFKSHHINLKSEKSIPFWRSLRIQAFIGSARLKTGSLFGERVKKSEGKGGFSLTRRPVRRLYYHASVMITCHNPE